MTTKKLSCFDDPIHYPGLTVHQPYAGLIRLAGMGFLGKDLEIRSRRIHYRGPLIIVASQRVDPEAYVRVQAQLVATGIMRQAFFNDHCGTPLCGKAVAVFHVADCRPMTDDDHQRAFVSRSFGTSGQHAWVASTIAALDPFNSTGAQGFSRVPRDRVNAAIKMSTTRAKRDAKWKELAEKKDEARCHCGERFPKHLAEFMNNKPSVTHACKCGVVYLVRRNKFVPKDAPKNVEVVGG